MVAHVIYRQNLLLGAFMILASELLFASMGAAVKAVAATGMPTEMTVFMRNLFGLLVLLPLLVRGGSASLRTEVLRLHLLRAGAGLAAMYCFFYALGNLPLAEGMLLKMTAPVFMPMIAWLWLSESLRPSTLFAVMLGFVGVYFVLSPGGEFNLVALIGLLGGAFAALAKSTVRRLGRSEPNLRVVFYFSLVGLLVSVIPLGWAWQAPTIHQWQWLFAIGLLGTLGQLLLTRGYAIAPSGRVSPFTYFSVVFGAGYGYLFWGELPTDTFVLGALFIALAGILTLRRRAARDRGGSSVREGQTP
jgi:drug/metabolite transporter (DMT)-like permease